MGRHAAERSVAHQRQRIAVFQCEGGGVRLAARFNNKRKAEEFKGFNGQIIRVDASASGRVNSTAFRELGDLTLDDVERLGSSGTSGERAVRRFPRPCRPATLCAARRLLLFL